MKQLTQSEVRKNGKVYKNVSSPATEGTMKQVTDIVEKDGTFSISTDGGKTYSPAVGAVPEALPQEASALKNGNLPTSGWTTIGISTEAAYAYTISDTSITANSDILMELTDDGGVKAYSMEAGKMTVIRDTVPTQPIPYTYKVKQTNASGQFTLVNHYVPNIPVTSVNGQTGAVTIAVPTKTSQLTNDSGFITASDIPTIPTKTSQLTNDSDFVTSADVPSKTSDLTNDSGFLTKNNIVAGDNVTVTDENGNVKISATGGGSGGVTYTKLTGSVDFTTIAYTDDPYFLDQNAATWSENSAVGGKALTSTTDIGLFIGTSYTMVVNIQGTSTMFSAKAEDGNAYGLQGVKVLWFKRENIFDQFFIFDHCTIVGENQVAGDGCIFVAGLGSNITIADINYFSGDRGVITPVTITNSAIKINSAVTMYINTDNVINGTKTNGSITLTASTKGSVSYEMEILDVPTEGLFEIINASIGKGTLTIQKNGAIVATFGANQSENATANISVPTKTSQLQNDSGFVTNSAIGKGTLTIQKNGANVATFGANQSENATANISVPTKTSQLQNDSGFVSVGEWKEWTSTSVLSEEGLYEIVTTEYPYDGNKTFFVQYEQGKPNNGACWVSVLTAGSVTVVSPICSGDGTLHVDRSGSGSSTTEPLPFKYRKITN